MNSSVQSQYATNSSVYGDPKSMTIKGRLSAVEVSNVEIHI